MWDKQIPYIAYESEMARHERYFRKPPNGLGGNWYMTSLFDKWIIQHNSGIKPEWFKTE